MLRVAIRPVIFCNRRLVALPSVSSLSSIALQRRSLATRDGKLKGKVALITGGAAGIGRETAIAMAKEDVSGLVLADMNEKGAQETVELVKKAGHQSRRHQNRRLPGVAVRGGGGAGREAVWQAERDIQQRGDYERR